MEGNGPSGGDIRHTGMTFGARNVYALDLAICDYIGLPYKDALTVMRSIERGLCPASGADVQWLGKKPKLDKGFKIPDSRPHDFTGKLPGFMQKGVAFILEYFWGTKPVILRDKCIGCGKCEESCAPKAIVMSNKKAVIDYKKCIKCYCCHELCPVQAVEMKRPRK